MLFTYLSKISVFYNFRCATKKLLSIIPNLLTKGKKYFIINKINDKKGYFYENINDK